MTTRPRDAAPSLRRARGRTARRGMLIVALSALALSAAACRNDAAEEPMPSAPHAADSPARTRSALEHYALDEPDLHATLPVELQEVSGVTDVSDTEMAAVQDEDGVVFFYDLEQKQVTRRIPFGPAGDYEGLTRVGERLFALRSDGTLYEIADPLGDPTVRTHELELPTKDNEGLCFDPTRNRLLISPKSRMGKGKEYKDVRPIYAFDLEQAALQPEPVLRLSVEAVQDFAEAHDLLLPEKKRKKGGRKHAVLRFLPSSLAVHPVTSEIFVLSATDRVLATFDLHGNVTGYRLLDAELFRHPEGISFLANADMLVTNEAAGEEPTLLRFRWRGPAPAADQADGSP